MTTFSMDAGGGVEVAASSTSRCGCCCIASRGSNQVEPFEPHDNSYHMVEVRPNRLLSVYHINARSRDKQFEKQMQNYVKQHYYGRNYRCTSLPQYSNLTTRVNKQSNPVNHFSSPQHPHIPQSDDVTSPSNLTVCVQSRETTASQIEPVVRAGDGSEKPMLFLLHGVGGSSQVFKAQIEHFSSQGFEIVAPELIGHGYSPGSRDKQCYLFEEILIDVLLIFDICCKKENVVIGHSYGACFAAVLARRRPHLVQKLVMISGGAPTPLAPQPGIFSCPKCFLACITPILRRGFNKNAFHKKNKVPDKERAFSVPTYVLKYTMNGQAWPEGDVEFHRWISCPTLLIHGRDDQLITLEEEHEMQEAIYGCLLQIIEDASHMVMMEQPEKVNLILQEFITGSRISTNSCENSGENLDSYRVSEQNNVLSDRSERVKSPPKQSADITPPQNNMAAQNGAGNNVSPDKHSNGQAGVAKDSLTSGDETRHSRARSAKSAKSIPSRLVSGNFIHKNN